MESIITSYNIDYEQLRLFLVDYNGFIAGSSALAAYFKQENIPVEYEPGDIDIWIPTDEPEFVQLFQEFIRIYGFTNSHEYELLDIISYIDYDNIANILSVTSFINCSEQKVQLILINADYYTTIYKYIVDHFDISVCATWWNPNNQVATTLDENNTKKMRMYILNDKDTTDGKERLQKRLDKYKQRGFKYITSQPLIYYTEDPRIFTTNKLSMEVATDIITFEDDINVQQFLEASHESIIVKCGTQLYAFNRKYITDYMHKHTGYIINNRESGFICTTPFNQTILHHDVNYIDYCDYSIYEFVYSHVVHYGSKSYSICKMNCYTVADWEKDNVVPSRVCNAPYASLAPLPRAPINVEVMV